MTLMKLGGIAAIVILGGIHWALSTVRPKALGWIVPALYICLVGTFVRRGVMTSWLDWVMALVALAVLAGLWNSARQHKTKAEMDRIDNTLPS
jgi:hypothetical protein